MHTLIEGEQGNPPACAGSTCPGSSTYSSPVSVSSGTTLKAVGCKLNYNASLLVSGTYN